MSDINLGGCTLAVIYVDPTIVTPGDGGTPATALNNLPTSLSGDTAYIIRRNELNVTATQQNTFAGTANALIGMPKTGTREWFLVPQEARDAWGTDTADYARVFCAAPNAWAGMFTIPTGRRLLFVHGCAFYWTGTPSSSVGHFFECAGTEAVDFSNCLFARQNLDWSDGVLTSLPLTTGYDMVGGAIKVANGGVTRQVNIVNCVFNYSFPGASYSTNHGAIWLDGQLRNLAICDNKFYVTCRDTEMYSYSYHHVIHVDVWDDSTANDVQAQYFNGNEMHILPLRGGSFNDLPALVYWTSRVPLYMEDFTIDVDARRLGTGETAPSAFRFSQVTGALVTIQASGLRMRRIGISLNAADTSLWPMTRTLLAVLWGRGYDHNNRGGFYESELTDCTVAVPDAGCAWTTPFTQQPVITVANDTTGCGNDSYVGRLAAMPLRVQDLSVEAGSRWALQAHCAYLVSGIDIDGALNVIGTTYGAIDTLTSEFPGEFLLWDTNSHTLTIGSVTANKNNPSAPYNNNTLLRADAGPYTMCSIGSCNIPLKLQQVVAAGLNHHGVCSGNVGTTGRFSYFARNLACDTWNVTRTGSTATATLQFSGYAGSLDNKLMLNPPAFSGVPMAPAGTGINRITMYVAAKLDGLTPAQVSKMFIMNVRVVGAAGAVVGDYCTNQSGKWEVDTSVWNNDTGLTAFKCTMWVPVAAGQTFNTTICYGNTTTGAVLYLDPVIAVALEP